MEHAGRAEWRTLCSKNLKAALNRLFFRKMEKNETDENLLKTAVMIAAYICGRIYFSISSVPGFASGLK